MGDVIKVTFDGDTKEITREKAFDFFATLFPRGIILTSYNEMVGLSVPPREDEYNAEGE